MTASTTPSRLVRQTHRWVSMLFIASVIATSVAMSRPEPLVWMAYVPLAPLALLALSGIWLFVLPYAARNRGRV